MSYYAAPRRPIRRKKDVTPMILAIVTVIGIPALGFAVYKLVINKPHEVIADNPSSSPYIAPPRAEKTYATPLPKTPAQYAGVVPDLSDEEFAKITANVPAGRTVDFSSNFGPGGTQVSPGGFGNNYSSGGGMQSSATAVADAGKKVKESVDLGKTLVVWLIDRTKSCESRREDVAKQLESILPTLAPPPEKGVKPQDVKLLHAVCSFAADVQFETKDPTSDVAEVRSALSNIKTDEGNVENTFKAVETVVGQYQSFMMPPHQRYLTIVIVTDEVGNDQFERDRVAELVKRNSVPVYVVGSSAAFGSTGGQAASAEGAGGQVTGPESRDVEWINLDFPGGMSMGGPTGQDCGVGPYSLSYLCNVSGGEYFAVGGHNVNLPPQYLPKYMSEKDYQAQVGGNKAMAALFAATRMNHAKQISSPQSSFEVDENGLAVVREIDLAMRPVALILPDINSLFDVLKKGEGDRAKIVEPRHQAAYDLALGRAMAAKVRAEGYIVLLAAFKAGRKTKNGAGVWSLRPADGIEKNSVLDGMAKKSREYLQGVIDKHPGTPWAQAAQQELSQPIGWVWQE